MLKRIIWLVIAFPVAVFLITLAIANRHSVRLVLDPFHPETPVLSLVLPFYGYLFAALLIGVLLGGFSTMVARIQGDALQLVAFTSTTPEGTRR